MNWDSVVGRRSERLRSAILDGRSGFRRFAALEDSFEATFCMSSTFLDD